MVELDDGEFMNQFREWNNEFRRRTQECIPFYLDHGRPSMVPYQGMWQELVAWERDRFEEGEPIEVNDLRNKLNEIVDNNPSARATFALNTTHLGREDEYDGR